QRDTVFEQTYHLGVPQAPLAERPAVDDGERSTGTTITFWPSADIFDEIVFDFETIRARFQQYAFLNKGLTIALTDERPREVAPVDALDETLDDLDTDVLGEETGSTEAAAQGAGSTGTTTATKPRSVVYRYDNGLIDYVTHLNKSKRSEPVHQEVIAFESA